MVAASIMWMLFLNPAGVLPAMLNASASGIQLGITLAGIYIVWMGIVQIATDSGLIEKMSKLMSPIIRFLFGKQSKEVNELIATNISANMIGAGAAATPAAISAIEKMEQEQKTPDGKPTTAMIMLFILSATSMQILPTTVIGILQMHGAVNAGGIILPTLIVSTLSTLVGVILVKIFGTKRGKSN